MVGEIRGDIGKGDVGTDEEEMLSRGTGESVRCGSVVMLNGADSGERRPVRFTESVEDALGSRVRGGRAGRGERGGAVLLPLELDPVLPAVAGVGARSGEVMASSSCSPSS